MHLRSHVSGYALGRLWRAFKRLRHFSAAEPPRPEASIVAETQRERALLREAERWTEEVLARVAGQTTATGMS